jgi:hypothetical protein
MKKKVEKPNRLLLIFLLSILVIGLLLVLIFLFGPKQTAPKSSLPIAQDPKTQFLEAIKKDKSACQGIQDQYYHNLCLYNFTLKEAVEKKEPSICDTLDQDFKETCQNNYYFQISQKEKDLTLCDKINFEPLKNQCQKEVKKLGEIKTGERAENPCQNLEGKEVKDVCSALFSLSENGQIPPESQCQSLKNPAAKEICLAAARNQGKIAVLSKEKYFVICDSIQDKKTQDLCLDLFGQLLR